MAKLRRRLSKIPFITVFLTLLVAVPLVLLAVDAPTGFNNVTNGFESQTDFDTDRAQFDSVEEIANGLGPVYNAQACRECHQNPVSGSATQVNEMRAGVTTSGVFTDHAGGSLINDRAIDPAIQEHVFDSDNTRTFRVSLNVAGDGFVEAINDIDFKTVELAQPVGMRGTRVFVPVLETTLSGGHTVMRLGRFGWKDQHASLLSFAADAYVNEMGITSPIFPNENTSNGNSVAAFDTVPDPEDAATGPHPFGPDVESFTRFMRSTEAPPRGDMSDPGVAAGEIVFNNTGCVTCHTTSFTTAATGTSLNGGFFVVPAALGSKTIHPYGDFLMHDVNTGDGIVQNGGAGTRNQVRTAPLWGLRTRTRLMHDGASLTIQDAILRHGNQAATTVTSFSALSPTDSTNLFKFLNSL
jgi:CxxC motif-containing protein (DUF1111 family)